MKLFIKKNSKKNIRAGNQERNKNTKRYLWHNALKVNNCGQEREVMSEVRKHPGQILVTDPKTTNDHVKNVICMVIYKVVIYSISFLSHNTLVRQSRSCYPHFTDEQINMQRYINLSKFLVTKQQSRN